MNDIILSNGMRVIYHQMLNTHSITLGIYMKTGSWHEKEEQQGITHLLEHLHFRRMGKMSQKDLYYRIESMGSNLKGVTYCDFLQYSMKIHPVYFKEAITILKELFYADKWSDEEFETEKQVVINQIKENNAYFDLDKEMRKFVFRDSVFAKEMAGTVESVSNLKLSDVLEHKKRIFHKNNVCICAAGYLTDENIEWLNEELEKWNLPEGNIEKEEELPRLFHKRKPDICFYRSSDNILDVNLAFDIERNPEEDEMHNILNCILGEGTGSNLQKRIREELTYSSNIYSYIERYKKFEVLHINFSVEKQLFLNCLAEVVKVIENLKYEISEKELDVSLPFYTKNKVFLEDDTEEMNFQLAYKRFVLETKTERNISEEPLPVIEELKKIAQKIFMSKNVSIAVAGDIRKIDKKDISEILMGFEKGGK